LAVFAGSNPRTEFDPRKTVASVVRKKPHLIRNAGKKSFDSGLFLSSCFPYSVSSPGVDRQE
jgi:hypothetical protein